MNKIFATLTALNLCGLIVIAYFHFTDNQKVVYVDSGKLINEYQGMIDARQAYQQKAATWKANVDTLTAEVQNQILAYEKSSAKMSAKERELSQELIRSRQQQLYQYQEAMNNQAQNEDSKMTADVLAQINAYVKQYGESHGYKIILAATSYGNLAYADPDLDITAEVLEGLNKQYQGK